MISEGYSHARIGDYALIGDCRSAALISRTGSLDWLCWPRFESPSWFAALLDPDNGGRCLIQPAADFTAERRYIDNTNVLETTFRTASGVARLLDLMPVSFEADKRHALRPEHELLRRIECTHGMMRMRLLYEPRPDYARRMPRLHDRGPLGVYCEQGQQLLLIRSDVALEVSADRSRVCAEFTLHTGVRRYVSLVFSDGEPAIIPSLGDEAEAKIRSSIKWWQTWAAQCTYEGPYRAAIVRSALVLKLLTFAPSGAVIAAPTTSLPEKLGGTRNWDYRYCWVRDASLTLQALFDLGYTREAQSYLSWLLHTTRITWPLLRVLYDVYGRSAVREQTLAHLCGFAGSRPVRIGNAAARQLQLDVYGEVLDAVYEFTRRGGRLSRDMARMTVGFGQVACRRWREPDQGIWEIRSGPRHHTFSKAMCWVALDRLIKLHEAGHLRISPERLTVVKEVIRQEIERYGFNERLESYVSVFGGDDVDASLLQLARYGYIAPDAARMRSTLALIHKRLGENGLLYRYRDQRDGLPPGEGAFGVCSFWAVTACARSGDLPAATAAFEDLLTYANDLGLFAEEIDPQTGAALGNFPQAFTHIGLIDAALALADRMEGRQT